MKPGLPLYGQILGWFFLNLAVLGLVSFLFVRMELGLGLDSLLSGAAGDRIQGVSTLIARELSEGGRERWDALLRKFSDAYGIEFTLFLNDASQLAGSPTDLPAAVRQKILEGRLPSRPALREPVPPRARKSTAAQGEPGAVRPARDRKFMLQTRGPTRYWVGVRIPVADGDQPRRLQTTLLAASSSLKGGGLFLDFTPWLLAALGAVLLSALLWFPFVRGVTWTLGELTGAAERIAEGEFNVQLHHRRSDELGRLGRAVNRLAERLAEYVTSQKRFMGDVAHELASPVARLQVALAILEERLEERLDERQRPSLEDLRSETLEMSRLVNELLSLSKAGLKPAEIKTAPVNLAEIVRRVADRENVGSATFVIKVPAGLEALAEPDLLARALGNVLRNAIRYASHRGPITVTAQPENEHVRISVADHGPGVPPECLSRLFDPFYRVDSSRTRQTGGAGLGLAITRSCVEASGGQVTAQNRPEGGLEVILTLPRAQAVVS